MPRSAASRRAYEANWGTVFGNRPRAAQADPYNYDRPVFNFPAQSRGRKKKQSGGRCACPTGARSVSTKGRGRGFVCQATKSKTVKKHGRTWLIKKPFVKAICH
jgi:hypothetical protein